MTPSNLGAPLLKPKASRKFSSIPEAQLAPLATCLKLLLAFDAIANRKIRKIHMRPTLGK